MTLNPLKSPTLFTLLFCSLATGFSFSLQIWRQPAGFKGGRASLFVWLDIYDVVPFPTNIADLTRRHGDHLTTIFIVAVASACVGRLYYWSRWERHDKV